MTSELFMASFDKQYENDDEPWSKKVNYLLNEYKKADRPKKEIMDLVTMSLCGWTIKTLIEKAKEEKDDLVYTYGIKA